MGFELRMQEVQKVSRKRCPLERWAGQAQSDRAGVLSLRSPAGWAMDDLLIRR